MQYGACRNLMVFLDYINWDLIFTSVRSSEDYWSEFINVVRHGIDSQIPKRKISGNPKKTICDHTRHPVRHFTEKGSIRQLASLPKSVLEKSPAFLDKEVRFLGEKRPETSPHENRRDGAVVRACAFHSRGSQFDPGPEHSGQLSHPSLLAVVG